MFHYHSLHESKSNLKDDKKTRRILSFEKRLTISDVVLCQHFRCICRKSTFIFLHLYILVPILLYQEYQYEI